MHRFGVGAESHEGVLTPLPGQAGDQVVLDLPGADFNITLWIDAETRLPVKRLIIAEGKNGPVRITENCTFNLNPKVDAGAFAFPL